MSKLLSSILLLLLYGASINAQKLQNLEIIRFEEPYEKITVMVDGANYDYILNEKTKYSSKKSGNVPFKYYQPGSFVDLDAKIVGRERFAKEVKLLSEYTPGKEKFDGVLEYHEGDMAFIDGRKVILDPSSKLKCKGTSKCGCTKNMQYLGFDELTLGDFLEVKGHSSEEGEIYVKEIKVCENVYSDTDKSLRLSVENSFNAADARSVQAPPDIAVPPNSLHQGKVKIGALEYKLHNDLAVQGYINVVGNKVIPAYARDQAYKDRHQVFFRFYVIENDIPNAFAFPNGMVFIHTGLLKLMENEAQLATVLGHEIAHITYEHATKRYDNNEYMDSEIVTSGARKLLRDIFPTGDGSFKGELIKGVGDAAIATKPSDLTSFFGEDIEEQADRVGLYYAFDAGYDIREVINFWRLMENQTKDAGYQNTLYSDVKKMFLSINLQVDNRPISSLAAETTRSLIDNFLNTIYTSHPSCKARIRVINDIINTVYSSEELNLKIGKEAYALRLSRI